MSLVSFSCRLYKGTLECLPFSVDHLDADIRQFRQKLLPVLLVQLLGEPLDILVLGFKVNYRMSRLGFQYVYMNLSSKQLVHPAQDHDGNSGRRFPGLVCYQERPLRKEYS
jgi:hypothetical protein